MSILIYSIYNYIDMGMLITPKVKTEYAEKLEHVFRTYEHCFDLNVALALNNLNEAECELIQNDENLKARIALKDAQMRDILVSEVMDIALNGKNDSVRFSALKELGRTMYPRRFGDNADLADVPTEQVHVYLPANGRN